MADLNNKINDEALDEVSGGKLNTGLKHLPKSGTMSCARSITVKTLSRLPTSPAAHMYGPATTAPRAGSTPTISSGSDLIPIRLSAGSDH